MTALTTAAGLSAAVGRATRSARFCVAGPLPAVDPGLVVDGMGAVKLPLKRAAANDLVVRCRVAPYGKGTQTLINTRVRKTFELDPTHFRLGPEWTAAVAAAARLAVDQLGLPADRVEARPYKLLVYQSGGFFLPHRDSEKHDGMVASLIVVLANRFEGGALVVRHGAATQTVRFESAAGGTAPFFAAFYADCEHEVQRVTHGVRLALAYNLVLTPGPTAPARAGKRAAPAAGLTASIAAWTATQPARPLVFALEHHYTERGLSLDLLKGADRQIADLVVPAAAAANCLVHLAQVARHLLQSANDGSFERGYFRGSRPRRAITIGETFEDELYGEQWADLRGKKQPWGAIALDLPAVVSSMPIDDWTPTTEDYEGYTGNAGNTLDRWYHRSAIVIWPRDRHFDIVASGGVSDCIPLFGSMVKKLATTPKKRVEAACTDCVRFARAIIARWPQHHVGFGHRPSRERSPLDDFPDLLLTLRDRDSVAQFLTQLAVRDRVLPLDAFVVRAGREFGWTAFARELRQLITPPPDRHGRPEVALRDVAWLAAMCLEGTADPDRAALAADLCALAVELFCAPFPARPAYHWPGSRREPSVSESALPLLVKALIASRRDDDLSRVIRFVESSPDEFRLDDCQVPALQSLVPWSLQHAGRVHPQLRSWLAGVRKSLKSATARRPAPPANWARPADVACPCPHCAQLKAFLADPAHEVGRIPAREDVRRHLASVIERHGCDVKHALERKGSPYSLVLTKTTGSFERAARRYEADRRLLEAVDEIGKR